MGRDDFQGIASSGDDVFIDSDAAQTGNPPLKKLSDLKTMEQLLAEMDAADPPSVDG